MVDFNVLGMERVSGMPIRVCPITKVIYGIANREITAFVAMRQIPYSTERIQFCLLNEFSL